ncbi:MAG: hypothetical protein ABJ308_04680 [Halieaceae bacterium]
MEHKHANKLKPVFARFVGLLALPITLSAVVGMATVKSPAEMEAAATYRLEQSQGVQRSESEAERVFQSDWGSANPDVYSRIAMAFDTEAMQGADLMRVECRSTLCKVVYEADSDIKVARVLPRQLAETFNSMVTVHSGSSAERETLVYVDIPTRG